MEKDMPGPVTHTCIVKRILDTLRNTRHKNRFLRSLESLFSEEERVRSCMTGALGPDIFHYVPAGGLRGVERDLHGVSAERFFEPVLDYLGNNNELMDNWSANSRAFLYGALCHGIADTIFHPFIYYWSGIPFQGKGKILSSVRRKNLLMMYTIDNYLASNYPEEMKGLCEPRKVVKEIHPAVVHTIEEGLINAFPDSSISRWVERSRRWSLLPGPLRVARRVQRGIMSLKHLSIEKGRKILLFLDQKTGMEMFVIYPDARRINSDILNHHAEGWKNPSGNGGLRYETVDNLIQKAVEGTLEVWESLEEAFMKGNRPDYPARLAMNWYTGEENIEPADLKVSEPRKVRYYF
jgi:hypothetical protein